MRGTLTLINAPSRHHTAKAEAPAVVISTDTVKGPHFMIAFNKASGFIVKRGPYVLIYALYLVSMWIGNTVGRYKSVVAEIAVGSIGRIKVTAVSIYDTTVLATPPYRLVDEVCNCGEWLLNVAYVNKSRDGLLPAGSVVARQQLTLINAPSRHHTAKAEAPAVVSQKLPSEASVGLKSPP